MQGGLRETMRIFSRLLGDRRFAPYALALALASCSVFAYIAGSSYVLENVFRTSPQVFSAVFAVNSVGFIVVAQVGGRIVGRFGPARLLSWGLVVLALASLGTLTVAAHRRRAVAAAGHAVCDDVERRTGAAQRRRRRDDRAAVGTRGGLSARGPRPVRLGRADRAAGWGRGRLRRRADGNHHGRRRGCGGGRRRRVQEPP